MPANKRQMRATASSKRALDVRQRMRSREVALAWLATFHRPTRRTRRPVRPAGSGAARPRRGSVAKDPASRRPGPDPQDTRTYRMPTLRGDDVSNLLPADARGSEDRPARAAIWPPDPDRGAGFENDAKRTMTFRTREIDVESRDARTPLRSREARESTRARARTAGAAGRMRPTAFPAFPPPQTGREMHHGEAAFDGERLLSHTRLSHRRLRPAECARRRDSSFAPLTKGLREPIAFCKPGRPCGLFREQHHELQTNMRIEPIILRAGRILEKCSPRRDLPRPGANGGCMATKRMLEIRRLGGARGKFHSPAKRQRRALCSRAPLPACSSQIPRLPSPTTIPGLRSLFPCSLPPPGLHPALAPGARAAAPPARAPPRLGPRMPCAMREALLQRTSVCTGSRSVSLRDVARLFSGPSTQRRAIFCETAWRGEGLRGAVRSHPATGAWASERLSASRVPFPGLFFARLQGRLWALSVGV